MCIQRLRKREEKGRQDTNIVGQIHSWQNGECVGSERHWTKKQNSGRVREQRSRTLICIGEGRDRTVRQRMQKHQG